MSFREECLAEVLRRGGATVTQVLGATGGRISAASAVSCGARQYARKGVHRPWSVERLAACGRRRMVGEILRRLSKEGRLRRVSPGVYAPPELRLYSEEGAA